MPRTKKRPLNVVDLSTPSTQYVRGGNGGSVAFASRLPVLARTITAHEKEFENFIRALVEDPVVKAAENHADSTDFLNTLKLEAAKETAFINQQKLNPGITSEEAASLSSKRISALLKLATLEKEIQKGNVSTVDLHGEKFQRVFQFWLETLREVADAIMAPEQVNMLFTKLEVALDRWEDKATQRMVNVETQNGPPQR